MDPRLLRHYNAELTHLREMGAEFARQFPKIAARLGIDGVEVSDPYVERLLEGAAFLTARVQLRLDSEFPRFTQKLLEIIYPQLQSPIPAMAMARFEPDLNDPALDTGFKVARGTMLRGLLGKGDTTACQFRTAHEVNLLPLRVSQVQYFSYSPDLPLQDLPTATPIKGGLRVRLATRDGLALSKLRFDRLPLYLSGAEETANRLFELIHAAGLGVLVVPAGRPPAWKQWLDATNIQLRGYQDEDALLPQTVRGFSGYRLLQEYFYFPQRFLFAELSGLARALRNCDASEVDLVIPFSRADAGLEGLVDESHVSLFCTPIINLFSRRTDRINVGSTDHELHLVVDRTRPMDFEIHSIEQVVGYDEGNQNERRFRAFYEAYPEVADTQQAYYSMQREPRLLSAGQKIKGFRSTYIGSEVFLGLVDADEAPFSESLKQVAVTALCTNRDLPLHMPLGLGKTDFTPDRSIPAPAIRCIRGPTRPRSVMKERDNTWALISHLSLNYLSLMDKDPVRGAAALRELLALYAGQDAALEKQVEAVRSVKVQPVTRRLPMPGPIAFGRGLRVDLEVNDLGFEGSSAFVFGTVMERFVARYVTLNSFTEFVLRTSARGELKRWAARCGTRETL